MNDYRRISAESQHHFHILPHFNSKTTELIFTIFSHDLELLVEKVKTVNFDVGKNRPKLIAYLGNVPWTTAKIMACMPLQKLKR